MAGGSPSLSESQPPDLSSMQRHHLARVLLADKRNVDAVERPLLIAEVVEERAVVSGVCCAVSLFANE